jgi:geranylgeranyl pyrophosphate synthase
MADKYAMPTRVHTRINPFLSIPLTILWISLYNTIMNDAFSPRLRDAPAPASLTDVRDKMFNSLRTTSLAPMINEISRAIGGGKMLRAKLTLTLGMASGANREDLIRAAAAVEMVHAASLLHDDVVDGGMLRRGAPTFWQEKSVSGAILLGDLLVCRAVQMMEEIENRRLGGLLVRMSAEMCDAEVEQELITRGAPGDWDKSVSMIRRKTGSLFAFAAAAADGVNGPRSDALMEAGYQLGTAFQMADDLMDASGKGELDGKDLGQDAARGKLTSVSACNMDQARARQCVTALCHSSSEMLAPWPPVQAAWQAYLKSDMGPVINKFLS